MTDWKSHVLNRRNFLALAATAPVAPLAMVQASSFYDVARETIVLPTGETIDRCDAIFVGRTEIGESVFASRLTGDITHPGQPVHMFDADGYTGTFIFS